MSLNDNSTSNESSYYYNEELARFTAYWYNVWMIGNVVFEIIAVPVGIVNCVGILIVMSLVKEGVAKSTRVYYLALAVADILPITGYHLLLSLLDEDLRYLSGNTKFVVIEAVDGWCTYSFLTQHFAEHVANWLYVVLCVERLLVVNWPLKVRGLFTPSLSVKVVLVVVITALPTGVLAIMNYAPYYYPDLQRTYCIIKPSTSAYTLVFPVYFTTTIYTVPILLTVVMSLLLTGSVLTYARNRQKLATDFTGNSKGPKAQASGLHGAITVLIMAVVHCIIYLPATGLYFCSGMVLTVTTDPFVSISVLYMSWLFLNSCALAHCQNIFIYTARIPAFRRILFCKSSAISN